MVDLIPLVLIVVFIPLALIMRKLRESPASVYVSGALSLWFIVLALVEGEDIYFKLFLALIGIMAALKFAKYSGMLK